MRLFSRKPVVCPWCDYRFPDGLPNDSPVYSAHYRTHTSPSVAPPPTDGSPNSPDAPGRTPVSDRPDVSPESIGPMLVQQRTIVHRDYVRLDPAAVHDMLVALRSRGYRTETLATI